MIYSTANFADQIVRAVVITIVLENIASIRNVISRYVIKSSFTLLFCRVFNISIFSFDLLCTSSSRPAIFKRRSFFDFAPIFFDDPLTSVCSPSRRGRRYPPVWYHQKASNLRRSMHPDVDLQDLMPGRAARSGSSSRLSKSDFLDTLMQDRRVLRCLRRSSWFVVVHHHLVGFYSADERHVTIFTYLTPHHDTAQCDGTVELIKLSRQWYRGA